MTYTVSILPVKQSTWDDIKARIDKINTAVGGRQYDNMFMPNRCIDLTHVAVQPDPQEDKSSTAEAVLKLIAEGYPVEASEDRYVRVENPKYKPDNGEDPFVVWDVHEGKPD